MSRITDRFPVAWARLTAWWPDLYVSVLIATASIVSLASPSDILDGTGVGALFPAWAASLWALILAGSSLTVIAAVVRRRYVRAADASTVLAVALALNGGVVVIAKGVGGTIAAAIYVGLALMLLERARQLDAPIPPPPGSYVRKG